MRRNVGNHHAVRSDDSAFTDRYTLHNHGTARNPSTLTNTDRTDFLGLRRQIRNAIFNIAGMGIGVHESDAAGNVNVVLDDNFFVNDEGDAMADVNAVMDDEFGLVKDATAMNVDLAEEIDIVADIDFGMPDNKRQSCEGKTFTDRFTSSAKKRTAVEKSECPAENVEDALMQGVAGAKNRHEETRERQVGSDQCLRQIVQKSVKGGLPAPDFKDERLEQENPPTEKTANFSLFERMALSRH